MIEVHIPEILERSIDLLLQYRTVERINDITSFKSHELISWSFTCQIKIPFPNQALLPELIKLEVVIDENYPFSRVICYSRTEELRGFPHQDAENHKLCLRESWRSENNEKKLVQYIEWAKQWLFDAAEGNLVTSSDPYELPDFSIISKDYVLPTRKQFLFNEDSTSYHNWVDKIGKNGDVVCNIADGINAIFLNSFLYEGIKINDSGFSKSMYNVKYDIAGIWQLLPSIYYRNFRPPQTFGELRELFQWSNIKLDPILRKVWEMDNLNQDISLILIGFPIPQYFNKEYEEIHWIPIVFNSIRRDKKVFLKCKKRKDLWQAVFDKNFTNASPIIWGKASNISKSRQFVRGQLHEKIIKKSFTLMGCGALGSHMAEYLVREGIHSINLFDNDVLMMGNLSRHTLDGEGIGQAKTSALEKRLLRISPLLNVKSYSEHIPFPPNNVELALLLAKTEILIDCTTDHNAFLWLDNRVDCDKQRLVSVFFNFTSDVCTVLVSGKKCSCKDIYNDLINKVKLGLTDLAAEEYFKLPETSELILEGIGCWHATFPGKEHEIALLAALALDIIGTQLTLPTGLAAIIKRKKYSEYLKDNQIVELLFVKNDYE